MNKRQLGSTDIYITPIGLGCMGLSEFYGPPADKAFAIKLLHEAIELGVKHFDTAEIYGFRSANETLGDALLVSGTVCLSQLNLGLRATGKQACELGSTAPGGIAGAQ